MDANRFDVFTKSMAAPASRRRALGALAGAGLLGALGFRPTAAVRAAQAGTCTYDFVTTVRLGPTSDQMLTNDAAQPGEARGELSFSLSATGALEDGILRLTDGTDLPVVGQATGNALQLRIAAGEGLVLVSVGVGEQEIASCQGAIDGLTTGPQAGDLGDWHAVPLGQATTPSTGGQTRPASGIQTNPSSGGQGSSTSGGRPVLAPPTGSAVEPATESSESASCPPNQSRCAGVCVDLSSDPDHCGGCQQPCVNAICEGGVCIDEPEPAEVTCEPGATDCGLLCVDLTSDSANCGACGNDCDNYGLFYYCEGGVCVPPCRAGFTDCSGLGLCADLMTDPFNCGGCGIVCPQGLACAVGSCTLGLPGIPVDPPPPPPLACAPGLDNCFGVCVDVSNNANNCGGCGIPCPAGQLCQGRVCVAGGPACGPGLTACGGVCLDLNSDPFACGACTNICPEGSTCQARVCTAPPD